MKKILALMGAVLLLSVSARAVEVSAPSAVLMEKETGTVLFAKNEHEKLEPASVTKIMTLLLTMEAIDGGTLRYEDTVTASPHACSMGGSQIWLKEGERLTVDEMLKAVCVVSANDCAVALAEHLAGSEEAFVERMNRRGSGAGDERHYFQKRLRSAGGGSRHLCLRHCFDEPGADAASSGYPNIYNSLDGHSPGWGVLVGQYQQAGAIL